MGWTGSVYISTMFVCLWVASAPWIKWKREPNTLSPRRNWTIRHKLWNFNEIRACASLINTRFLFFADARSSYTIELSDGRYSARDKHPSFNLYVYSGGYFCVIEWVAYRQTQNIHTHKIWLLLFDLIWNWFLLRTGLFWLCVFNENKFTFTFIIIINIFMNARVTNFINNCVIMNVKCGMSGANTRD